MRRAKGDDSVTKRKDGRWHARYKANGKRRHIYGNTKSEVAKKLNEALHVANRGPVYEYTGTTLGAPPEEQHMGSRLEASNDPPTSGEEQEPVVRPMDRDERHYLGSVCPVRLAPGRRSAAY